jgi:uncharacterized protein YukE
MNRRTATGGRAHEDTEGKGLVGMKFDMGEQTLSTLQKQTGGSSQDLGGLIKRLIAAAEPLEGRFNGAGRAAFDQFKAHSDEITGQLNGALSSILGGQAGMDKAFGSGDHEHADNARQAMGSANFDAARFSGR